MKDALASRLVIDPPRVASGRRISATCRVFDARLGLVARVLADGRPHEIPSGWAVILLEYPDGFARRRVIRTEPRGEYRLRFKAVDADVENQGGSALAVGGDPAYTAIAYLESAKVADARELIQPLLGDVATGQLEDPIARVAIAYVLTQTWEWDVLYPWILDIAADDPWLSDGYVLQAEWHAHRGEHLAALNCLQHLRFQGMPVFARGISMALERLASYGSFSVKELRVMAPPKASSFEAIRWLGARDIEVARATYDSLVDRSMNVWISGLVYPESLENADLQGNRSAPAANRRPLRQESKPNPHKGVSTVSNSPEKPDEKRSLRGLPLAVAVGAMTLWAVFIGILLFSTGVEEATWLRMTFIFSSVQAIAFAAAGALFGVAVQQERVQKAEETAEVNASDAANGRALAITNIADGADVIDRDDDSAFEQYGGPASVDVRRRHADLARNLFPGL